MRKAFARSPISPAAIAALAAMMPIACSRAPNPAQLPASAGDVVEAGAFAEVSAEDSADGAGAAESMTADAKELADEAAQDGATASDSLDTLDETSTLTDAPVAAQMDATADSAPAEVADSAEVADLDGAPECVPFASANDAMAGGDTGAPTPAACKAAADCPEIYGKVAQCMLKTCDYLPLFCDPSATTNECMDDNYFTYDYCGASAGSQTPNGFACVHLCTMGGCLGNMECDDGNPCTIETCIADSGCPQCWSVKIPGCCTAAADCDDGDPCTQDICAYSAWTCQHPWVCCPP